LGLSLSKKNCGLYGPVVEVVFEDEHLFPEGTDSIYVCQLQDLKWGTSPFVAGLRLKLCGKYYCVLRL